MGKTKIAINYKTVAIKAYTSLRSGVILSEKTIETRKRWRQYMKDEVYHIISRRKGAGELWRTTSPPCALIAFVKDGCIDTESLEKCQVQCSRLHGNWRTMACCTP
jgi:hypothetical protein